MVSFRKLVMAMVLLVIVAGIALAQTVPQVPIMSCQPYNQQTARLRSEGVTELIPDLTLVCMSTYQIPNTPEPRLSGTYYDWFVYFPANAPLTSSTAKIDGWKEPQIGIQVVPVTGGTPGSPESDIQWQSAAKMTAGNGSSGGSVEFDTVNMNPNNDQYRPAVPADLYNNVFVTIVGLRVDAIALASSGPLSTPNALTLTLFAQPSHTTSAVNQQNPGNIFLPLVNGVQQYTLSISVGYSAPSLTVSENGVLTWQQCFDWRRHRNDNSNGASDTKHLYFAVDFNELYSFSFAPPVDGWETPPAYVDPDTGMILGGGNRLFFTFSSDGENAWPPFVQLEVPQGVQVFDSGSVIVRALLVTDPNPDGSGGTVVDDPWPDLMSEGNSWHMHNAGGEWYGDWYTVDTSSGGSNMVVYQIVAATPAVTTTLEVPVRGSLIDTPTIYPVPDGTNPMVSITHAGYAPWTPASVPQDAPIPRFHGPAPFTGSNLLVINPCVTNLLYPYVVAGMGWDTGITVANSGMDPFGEFSPYSHGWGANVPAVPGTSANGNSQPGVCYLYFYGSIDRGAPLVTPDTNPPNAIILGAAGFGSGSATGDDGTDYIQPGTTSEDLVMAVLALNNPAVDFTKHSWNGYVIAQCDFLYAHGYAFTVFHDKSFTLGGNLSLGYLALVFNQRGITTSAQAPEGMTF